MLVYPKDAEFVVFNNVHLKGKDLPDKLPLPADAHYYYCQLKDEYSSDNDDLCIALTYQENAEVKIAYCRNVSQTSNENISCFCDVLQVLAIDCVEILELPKGTEIANELFV